MNQAVQAGKPDSPLGSDALKALTFTVSSETLALPISRVKEIIEYTDVTRIPMVPNYIRGVINLRGSVVPVIDLAARLERPSGPTGRRTCVIIVELAEADGHLDVGIMVDAVNEVLDIPPGDVEPPPSFGASVRADFIEGMAKGKGGFTVVLNAARVLSLEELSDFGHA